MKPYPVRVSKEWFELQETLNRELSKDYGRKITHPEMSREIAQFLYKENLVPIMVRRARIKMKRRGGLFV